MRVYHFIVSYVVLFTTSLWFWHRHVHGSFNAVQMALSFFSVINVMICLWEIALWQYIEVIKEQFKANERRWKHNRTGACIDFFVSPLTWSEAFSFHYWTRVWSVYSLFDPSYSNERSYGFYIDAGNGHTMLLPSLLWCVNMTTLGPLSAPWMGFMGIISFYQMLYGTVIYFISFFTNRCHRGKTFLEVLLFVGVSNGIWASFPLLGIWTSIQLLLQNNFSYFLQ
jgi:hypothetical protein